MAKTRSVAALVIIETDDARLDPERIDVSTAAKATALRQAVIDNLPKLTRVVLVTSEDDARTMCEARDAVIREMGLGTIARPPADYVPPARD